MGWYGLKGVQGQVHCLKPGQVTDHHETGYKLAYDGCQSGSGHSHVESKYKQGIQYGVDPVSYTHLWMNLSGRCIR